MQEMWHGGQRARPGGSESCKSICVHQLMLSRYNTDTCDDVAKLSGISTTLVKNVSYLPQTAQNSVAHRESWHTHLVDPTCLYSSGYLQSYVRWDCCYAAHAASVDNVGKQTISRTYVTDLYQFLRFGGIGLRPLQYMYIYICVIIYT